MDRDKLIKELSGLSQDQICWFAFRCALRSLPLLACNNERFFFWGDVARRNLFAIFRACNASISLISIAPTRFGAKADAYFAAYSAAESGLATAKPAVNFCGLSPAAAAAAVVDSASAAAATAVAIYTTGSFSHYSTAGDSLYYAADAFTAFAAAAYCAESTSTVTAIHAACNADISFLNNRSRKAIWSDLWHGNSPNTWLNWEKNFLKGLRLLNLEYWIDEYSNWVQGRFDMERLEHCLLMPRETIEAGPEAMLIYLYAELVRFTEARVIFLGEGEAGKTSLIRRIHGEDIRGDEPPTPRIEIRHRQEIINGDNMVIHYWDFGGQVIMHATHQFFMREKSVYVIVLDIRRCDNLEYWIDHVRVFAPGANTIIVLNKIDCLPPGIKIRHPFDINEIHRKYPFVNNVVYPLSCKNSVGIADFSEALKTQITQNNSLSLGMPLQWFNVKEALAKEKSNCIDLERFDEICREQGIPDGKIESTLNVLDNLGLAIHFPELRDSQVVLNPEWITKAIYYIIWASEKQGFNGKLSVMDIKTIFAKGRNTKELNVDVPDDKCRFLLELMTQFKLAFKIKMGRGKYCVPMLTPVLEPNHSVAREGGLRFLFVLPFLPPGFFFRFISESGDELVNDWIWKTGAILSKDDTIVKVDYSEYQRTINFYAHGQHSGIYLTTLRQRFMKLLGESYKELDYEPYVVTPEGDRISWREMLQRYGNEGKTAKIYAGEAQINIYSIFEKYIGKLGDKLDQTVNRERSIMINISNENTATSNPAVTVNQATTVSVTVSAFQSLLPVDSNLIIVKELINDFREDNKVEAEKYKKELRKLEREIDRLRSDIADIETVADDNPSSEAKRKTILGRFKERWDNFAKESKQWYYIIGFAEKIDKIASIISKIGWTTLI